MCVSMCIIIIKEVTFVGVVCGVGVKAADELRVAIHVVDPTANLFYLKLYK